MEAYLMHLGNSQTANRFTEDFIGVEAAQFFCEAVAEAAPREGGPLRGLSGLGELGDGVSRPEQPDDAGRLDQLDAPDSGAGHVREDFDRHRLVRNKNQRLGNRNDFRHAARLFFFFRF